MVVLRWGWGLGLLFNVADGVAPALLGALVRAFRGRLSVVFACAGRQLFAEARGRFLVGAGMDEIVGNGPMPPPTALVRRLGLCAAKPQAGRWASWGIRTGSR